MRTSPASWDGPSKERRSKTSDRLAEERESARPRGIRMLEQDGWRQVLQCGGHRQFRHQTKHGRVTVARKPSQELAPGTLGSILRQAGLSKEAR